MGRRRNTTRRHLIALVLVLSSFGAFQKVSAQDLLTDFWPARNLAILHDFGHFWSVNSTFKPYRWERLWGAEQHNGIAHESGLGWILTDLLDETTWPMGLAPGASDSLQVRVWTGALLQQPFGLDKPFPEFAGAPYINFTLWFRQRLSVELYLRATSEPLSLPHFTGKPRKVRRFGLNSAEFDHAVVSYHNSWLIAQFGRGRQVWGPVESNNLALSTNSAAYDQLLLEGRYKRFKVRFFYGFLESISLEGNINRYLVGHGLEYSNRRNLILGASEIIILSGEDRPLDISYLNPLLPVLEVELNGRTNKDRGTASSNAVWSLMFDWLPLHGVRLSGNFTVDEFQFDKKDREEGRPDAVAYQFRGAYSRNLGSMDATFSVDYTRVGTFTFRHESGTNNFVSRNLPLGSEIGSDADRWRLGLRLLFPWRVIFSTAFGMQRVGERNLLSNSYASYTAEEFHQGPFPSGEVQKFKFLEWHLSYNPKRNIELVVSGRFSGATRSSNESQRYVILSVNAYLPWRFGL
ncbi:MAG: capsule assembly Wzi family protein [bacterium]